ncbi:MAG: GatB/YqeY domain-containing protein [bacterium]|nr:GatB/YqeY domain-containing protein [bacterium]
MALKDTLYADMTAAMKAGDKLKLDALRMIKAEILKYETSAAGVQTTDENVIQILNRAVKQRKEAAEGFTKGGNQEMAAKELKEAEIYQAYLPAQMGEEEVKKIVQETIAEVGASGPGDIGKVMAAIMPKVKGKADGGLVNRLVKEALS